MEILSCVASMVITAFVFFVTLTFLTILFPTLVSILLLVVPLAIIFYFVQKGMDKLINKKGN